VPREPGAGCNPARDFIQHLQGSDFMSHTLHPLRRQRLQRSTLAVPGSNPSMIEKAADSAADVIFLDLEDAVAPPEKEKARNNIIQALNDIDWKAKGKTMSVRINGLDTHYMYRDVVEMLWNRPGSSSIPFWCPRWACLPTSTWSRRWSTRSSRAMGFTARIGLEALIETALGMANVEAIAATAGLRRCISAWPIMPPACARARW
jgi:citrate lyase beta subunit